MKLTLEQRVARLEQHIRNQSIPVLKPGYLPIKDAWRKHCKEVTYETFKGFIQACNMPTFPLVIYRKGHAVDTKQVKVTNVHKLKDHILFYAYPTSHHYFGHRDYPHKFLIKR